MKTYEKYLSTIIECQDIDTISFVVENEAAAKKVARHLTKVLSEKDLRTGIFVTICTQPTGFIKIYKVKLSRSGNFAKPLNTKKKAKTK